MTTGFGLVAPTGTPKDAIDTINKLIEAMLADTDALKRMEASHLDYMHLSPEQFSALVKSDYGKWERVDVLNPTGSVHSPIDAKGITEKFRGINPQLPADKIAAVALDIEQHHVRELLALMQRA